MTFPRGIPRHGPTYRHPTMSLTWGAALNSAPNFRSKRPAVSAMSDCPLSRLENWHQGSAIDNGHEAVSTVP